MAVCRNSALFLRRGRFVSVLGYEVPNIVQVQQLKGVLAVDCKALGGCSLFVLFAF